MTDQIDLPLSDEFDPERYMKASFDDVPSKKWARSLVEAVEVQEATFRRMGYSPEDAMNLARAGMLALSQLWGGRSHYLPSGDSLNVALRDAEIFRRANRDNMGALAAEYKMSQQHIERIVRIQGRLHRRRTQGSLFHEPD
ncbi:Mor transcription activator family protein [Stenotrophomonas sp. PS02298]|uniref:Mor transcription activator family protein n=1 Tax=Stenotrophomonas sp. PS02298 TaxID=2991424 RepID=UPI00249AAF07|nr:Mor transcription activator family protein [Stenotrophomonas sp. PS02298]